MKTNPKVAIVGGGRFGLTLADALSGNGIEVILVDKKWEIVQSLADSSIHAVQGDATNPDVLRDAGFADCDIAVIAIGESLEASTLATIHCKDLKIPRGKNLCSVLQVAGCLLETEPEVVILRGLWVPVSCGEGGIGGSEWFPCIRMKYEDGNGRSCTDCSMC